MSAVGNDAAFMLEKALEEMDDIFKDGNEPITFVQSSTPVAQKRTSNSRKMSNNNVTDLIKLLDELEFLLSGQILDEGEKLSKEEKITVLNHGRTLSFASAFLKEFHEPKTSMTTVSLYICTCI